MWPTDLPFNPLNKGWTAMFNFHVLNAFSFPIFYVSITRRAVDLRFRITINDSPLFVMISLSRLASFAAVQPPASRRQTRLLVRGSHHLKWVSLCREPQVAWDASPADKAPPLFGQMGQDNQWIKSLTRGKTTLTSTRTWEDPLRIGGF
jgi:hypothetical protein